MDCSGNITEAIWRYCIVLHCITHTLFSHFSDMSSRCHQGVQTSRRHLDDTFIGLISDCGGHNVVVLMTIVFHPYVCLGVCFVVSCALLHCDARPLNVLHICPL